MPTEDGLRADQEGGPGWSRQPTAERCWEQPITGLPSWTPGLALEDANLIAEKKYLRLQAGLGVAADKQDIEVQAEKAVDKGQEHDPATSQARLPIGVCRTQHAKHDRHHRSARASARICSPPTDAGGRSRR